MPTTASGRNRSRARRDASDTSADAVRIDGPNGSSVSSAPNDGRSAASRGPWSTPSASLGHEGHELVAVGPGLAGSPLLFPAHGLRAVNALPVRVDKIEPPYVRPDVLSRHRLNSWLDRAARARAALVIADTGFGKTTLLSDWSNQTSRNTSWYRLEHDDREWLTFVRHLVAGGRKVDPEFAPETYRLLCMLGPGGPTQAEVVESLAREMSQFGAASPDGFSLILDDYGQLEGCEETEPIVAALLGATGSGFSVIFAARSDPELPPVRLKGRNAVQRLDGDQLRFDVPETEALFGETYGIPLEHDVAVDLVARTEGWAALLSLVRTRLEESSTPDPRALVAQLSATEGDLYDFLAEEVLAEAPPDLADFMSRISILDEVTVPAAAAVVARDPIPVAADIRSAEGLGLLIHIPGSDRWRFGALVREFLYAHLEQTRGRRDVRRMHTMAARHFDGEDWLAASRQYVLAGTPSEATRLVAESLGAILGQGAYRSALDVLSDTPNDGAVSAMLEARSLLQLGASREALVLAQRAVEVAEAREQSHLGSALRNAATVAIGVHKRQAALDYGRRAVEYAADPADRRLAECQIELLTVGDGGNLPAFALKLEQLRAAQEHKHQRHYEAITDLNLALIYVWLGRHADALRLCSRADHLLATSSQGYEHVSVKIAAAWANAFTGQWRAADMLINQALAVEHPEGRAEAILDAAWIAAWFGPIGRASDVLRRVQLERLPADWVPHWRVVELWASRAGPALEPTLDRIGPEPTGSYEVAAAFRWHLSRSRAFLVLGQTSRAQLELGRAEEIAHLQGSRLQQRMVEFQAALIAGADATSRELANTPADDDPIVGIWAPEISERLGDLSSAAWDVVYRCCRLNPDRWREPIRDALTHRAGRLAEDRAAAVLEEIGDNTDIEPLREFARRRRAPERWGESLARRLAPRLWIDDLGLVTLAIGERRIDGQLIRHRALELLLFLVAQPSGAATPDQLIEALWPEIDPEAALNSVHQTIYVLRRVFDPGYKAGVSPEYVHFDADLVRLDPDLVDCRSWLCRRLLTGRQWTVPRINELVTAYRHRFAAEFSYEEWASSYRERLHALYLAAVEQAVSGRLGLGDASWRLWVGQQVLLIDPEADSIEAHVIGLYRAVDATAAAREQYAHYAAAMRDQLGVEPPELEDL